MSINVTVSGNPVSIKRGKMVTSDPYTNKKEFDKRRLLRLEQVRQQSKELAEDVRNKVRKEKKKQMGEIEKEGKEKLKSWQNRKLLELQNQYREALDDIGGAHKEAEQLESESLMLAEQQLRNEEIAQNRGRLAESKLQVQKNEKNYKKAMPIQHKKLVRDIENTRAALVSCMKQKNNCQNKAKKPKASADINITIPDDSDFEEESSSESSSHLPNIQEENLEDSEGFCECSECSDDKVSSETPPDNVEISKTSAKESRRSEFTANNTEANHQPNSLKSLSKSSQDPYKTDSKQKSFQQSISERRKLIEEFRNRSRDVPLDTRISDRIRRRQQMASQPDFCDEVVQPTPVPEVQESSRLREKISSRPSYFGRIDDVPSNDPLELSSDECVCSKSHAKCPCKLVSMGVQADLGNKDKSCKCTYGPSKECKRSRDFIRSQSSGGLQQKEAKLPETGLRPENTSLRGSSKSAGPPSEIPSKPSVKLKDLKQPNLQTQTSAATSNAYKVRHYDFPTRFEKEIPSTSQVEKITEDSLEVIPNSGSEAEWHEKMKQRDREAQIRGQRALEKEKVQRDYEEMMKKLPILQRKEHIAQIGKDKPEYHMSEERLKQREKERQNRLENAYAQAMPDLKPQIVTIPSRKHEIPKNDEPFEILDGDDSRTLNLGKWDTETSPKKMFSAEEVQEIIKAFTVQKPEDRKAKLKQLLKSLKLQKEQLINEIRSLPKDDSITALISDLNSFSDNDKHHKSSKHRRRDKDGNKDKRKRRRESDSNNTSSDTPTNENESKVRDHRKPKQGKSPLKKMRKSRPRVLVLQNMSTQTTPKVAKQTSSTPISSEVTEDGQKQASTRIVSGLVGTCIKAHTPCDCNKEDVKSSEEVCKILIKLHEDEFPKVEVMRGAKDNVEFPEKAKTVDIQERSPKVPYQEKEKSLKSPTVEKGLSGKPETERISPKGPTKRVETKSVATETDAFKIPLPKKPKKLKPTTLPSSSGEMKRSPGRKRSESWKEHLSKNSMSTSSTSYLSPPDFSKPNTTASTEPSKQSMYNLRKKPQQTNFDRSSTLRTSSFDQSARIKDQKLLNYIKRLLGMSKISVDELGVSSSDVQTPNQSVIEMESNNPMAPLHNIIKFINLRAADIAKELSVSPDDTPVPPNSVASVFEGSGSKVQDDDSLQHSVKDTNGSSSNKTKESLILKYTDVTDSCSKRIANLAAMIEKLREEKMQMLQSPPIAQRSDFHRCTYDQSAHGLQGGTCDLDGQSRPRSDQVVTPGSDKDNSTRYLDFPPSGEKSKGTSSTASMDEEELNKRLLEIDMSLAEKLKRFGQQKDDKSGDSSGKSDKSTQEQSMPKSQPEDQLDQADQDFLRRLQRLIEENHEKEQLDQRQSLEPPQSSDVPFVPFLVDIPKLPILEPQPESPLLDYPVGPGKRHPPPSKGLITAKKFNGNISLVPHELSTIIEADSQLSTRISPNDSKTGLSPCKDTNLPLSPTLEENSLPIDKSFSEVLDNQSPVISEHKSDDNVDTIPSSKDQSKAWKSSLPRPEKSAERPKSFKSLDFSDSSKSLTCNEPTCASLISTTSSSKKSSSSSSDMASIEAMLRSIGMDWAIPTLHKTQEALALSSTSSSDLSSKRKSRGSTNSSSEVSLKDFLKKQMISKISSSSLNKSDASPASFLQEFSEISAIHANSSSDKGKQRTSTPVLSSKSSSKAKDDQALFTGASDISSVRNSSCEGRCKKSAEQQTFHTLGSEEELSSKKFDV